MRTRTVATVAVLVVAWAASWSAAQTPEDDARARAAQMAKAVEMEAKRQAEADAQARAAAAAKQTGGAKAELDRFIANQVPPAGYVGVGSVVAAKVKAVPLEGGGAGVEFHTLEVKPAKMLYGLRPEGEKLSLHVLPQRDPQVAKLTKGDKIIFAFGRTPRQSHGAVRWSKQAEEAVLGALAPGWERGKCFRCPWCRQKAWVEGTGKCGLCNEAAASQAFKYYTEWTALTGRCQMCKRTVGPATKGVRLRLSGDPKLKVGVAPAAMGEVRVQRGEQIQLYVSARVEGKAAVSELLCPDGRALSGCQTLYFIVDAPGRREAAVLFPVLPLRRAKAELAPKPLTNSYGAHWIFAARMVLDDKKKVFERPGRYTVRAAAGRLVSKPVTVVVEERKPVVAPPQPPAPRPAWIDNVVAQITPDGNGVQAMMNGKGLWTMWLSDGVGAIEQKDGRLVVTSKDGKTVTTLDLATGRVISRKVAR